MDIGEKLVAADAQEFGTWLANNGEKAREVWVVFHKKTSNNGGISYPDAVRQALRFGWIDGQMKGIDSDTYAIRFSPRRKNSAWSSTNRETARALIAAGQMTPAGLATVPDDL